MRVSDFHFDLPEELIAQHPPAERGASRMLVLDRETDAVRDAMFRDLPEYLRAGDLLVLNDSRVLPARLFAMRGGLRTQVGSARPSGVVEVLLTEEVEDPVDPTSQTRDVGHPACWGAGEPILWKALVKPAKKVRVGETLHFMEIRGGTNTGVLRSARNDNFKGSEELERSDTFHDSEVLTAEVVEAGEFGERTLRFRAVEDFYERVGRIGHMPLPPYIRREQAAGPDSAADRERYQTVYSQRVGSAAAPTAGLHFTPEILAELKARGVEIEYVTLHVGLGTFQPVRVERLEDIRLHAERYTLPAATAEALNRALAEGRRVVAVGTTTTRTLEHIAAEAEQANHREHGETERTQRLGAPVRGKIEAHSGATSIFIGPGHTFRVVSGLLTNFHLPESTLVMLVGAFAGREQVLGAYAHAIGEGYRFYSYGDCMLVV
jgi:S-adenosylmethionine:tRNA ribosyltransferase-isomerase